jgi:hypothetical protein
MFRVWRRRDAELSEFRGWLTHAVTDVPGLGLFGLCRAGRQRWSSGLDLLDYCKGGGSLTPCFSLSQSALGLFWCGYSGLDGDADGQMHRRARLIVPRIVVSGVRNDISDTRQRKLLDAEFRHLPRQTPGTRHPEQRNTGSFPWKPKCIHHFHFMHFGRRQMWFVWGLGAVIGLCLLLSVLDSPPTRRAMRGQRRG